LIHINNKHILYLIDFMQTRLVAECQIGLEYVATAWRLGVAIGVAIGR